MKALITDVAQATPDRLTNILHEQGCLSHGEVVTVRKESPYFSGTSILSRLTLGYSPGASAPSRLLLKIPLPEPAWVVTPGQRRKEVDFYCAVARYHATLLTHGLTRYDWEDCWCDYRLSVIRQLFVPVLLWLHKLPPDAWWPHLENAALAYQDLSCAELLEG